MSGFMGLGLELVARVQRLGLDTAARASTATLIPPSKTELVRPKT